MRRAPSSVHGGQASAPARGEHFIARRRFMNIAWLPLAASLGCVGAGAASPPLADAPTDWNVREVEWMPYEAGMAAAKAEHKPIVLVLYTDWCPHCHNYSRLFHDPELVRLSRAFVMIRVERDEHRDIGAIYDIDGEYVPRTFLMTPTGAVLTDLASDNDDFRYFLDEHDPAELIALMRRALERTGTPPPAAPAPRAD